MAEFLSLVHGSAWLPLLFEDTCGPYRRSQPLPDGRLPLRIKDLPKPSLFIVSSYTNSLSNLGRAWTET